MKIHDLLDSVLRTTAILATVLTFQYCTDSDPDMVGIKDSEEGISYLSPGKRVEHVESRRVVLFYECGFNSLNTYLAENMDKDLPQGYLPTGGRNDDVVLVFSKIAGNSGYSDVSSYLRRLYKDSEGNFVSDTIKTYPSSTVASSGATMNDVLTFVQTNFPAKGYGMIFSSHGSGWLPNGYYSNPSDFERKHKQSSDGRKLSSASRQLDIPEGDIASTDPYAHMVRSIGQDKMSSGDVEMDITEFAEGIPFKLDYLLFDMCFSGGIEVAYALKDKTDYLGVSPAEVLAAGTYDYTALLDYLIGGTSANLSGLFKDSFDRYNKQSGDYRSSTVTLVRTDGLDHLAAVCKDLIDDYSEEIANAPARSIQGYFRENRHYFYDLEDIFSKSGVPESAMSGLRSAIDGCVVYKAATPYFISSFAINTYSGFSMYLPNAGTTLLDSYYKNEPWNKAVNLVK